MGVGTISLIAVSARPAWGKWRFDAKASPLLPPAGRAVPPAAMAARHRWPVASPSIGGWAWRRFAPMMVRGVLRDFCV